MDVANYRIVFTDQESSDHDRFNDLNVHRNNVEKKE